MGFTQKNALHHYCSALLGRDTGLVGSTGCSVPSCQGCWPAVSHLLYQLEAARGLQASWAHGTSSLKTLPSPASSTFPAAGFISACRLIQGRSQHPVAAGAGVMVQQVRWGQGSACKQRPGHRPYQCSDNGSSVNVVGSCCAGPVPVDYLRV